MRKLTATTFVSLDGVLQAPGGPDEDREGGFDLGGWQVPFVDDDNLRYIYEWFARADGFLLGRKTYEIFAAHWPYVTDRHEPVAAKLNTLPKYVASNTLTETDWHNSSIISGDVPAKVAELKRSGDGEIQVHGSGNLLQTLLEHELVDEHHVFVYPVVLGAGKRLYPDGSGPGTMELLESKRTASGAVVNTYTPAGRLEFGSFLLDR